MAGGAATDGDEATEGVNEEVNWDGVGGLEGSAGAGADSVSIGATTFKCGAGGVISVADRRAVPPVADLVDRYG